MNRKVLAFALSFVLCVYLFAAIAPIKATTFYKYVWTYNWGFSGWFARSLSNSEEANNVIDGMNSQASTLFSTEMLKHGHYYKIDSTASTCVLTARMPLRDSIYDGGQFNGTTIINFETDQNQADYTGYGTVKPASYPNLQRGTMLAAINVLPLQGWEELLYLVCYVVLAVIATVPGWALGVIGVIIAIGITAWILHQIGGVSGAVAPGLAGEIMTAIIIVGVILILIGVIPALAERYLGKSVKIPFVGGGKGKKSFSSEVRQ